MRRQDSLWHGGGRGDESSQLALRGPPLRHGPHLPAAGRPPLDPLRAPGRAQRPPPCASRRGPQHAWTDVALREQIREHGAAERPYDELMGLYREIHEVAGMELFYEIEARTTEKDSA